ncbi:MAG: glutaredoxin domain-containing protein [Dehalococcoidales bacterium]|nr:glutaredoxin domain-containing protein [Dehalococcoidales bacterium]
MRAKEYLSQRGVKFEDINVAQNREAAKEMIAKSKQMGVPVIMVDDDFVVGFSPAKIEELLAKP